MTLAEIADQLPNGFHDAQLLSMSADFVCQEARLTIDADVTDPDNRASMHYRRIHLLVRGVSFLSCEYPSMPWQNNSEGLWIDGVETRNEPKVLVMIPQRLVSALPESAFMYSFYVNDWNGFIHLAGLSAEFQWSDEVSA